MQATVTEAAQVPHSGPQCTIELATDLAGMNETERRGGGHVGWWWLCVYRCVRLYRVCVSLCARTWPPRAQASMWPRRRPRTLRRAARRVRPTRSARSGLLPIPATVASRAATPAARLPTVGTYLAGVCHAPRPSPDKESSLMYVSVGATSGSRHPPPPPGSGTRVAALATTSSSAQAVAEGSLAGVSVFLSFWSDTGKEADRTVVASFNAPAPASAAPPPSPALCRHAAPFAPFPPRATPAPHPKTMDCPRRIA